MRRLHLRHLRFKLNVSLKISLGGTTGLSDICYRSYILYSHLIVIFRLAQIVCLFILFIIITLIIIIIIIAGSVFCSSVHVIIVIFWF